MNSYLMMGMFILGIVLLISSMRISSAINSSCMSDTLRNANRGILVIGLTAIVSSISFLICNLRCDCFEDGSFNIMAYIIFVLALGITLITLGAIVQAQAKGACKNAKDHAVIIWVIGVIMTLVSVGYIGFQLYESGVFAKGGSGKHHSTAKF